MHKTVKSIIMEIKEETKYYHNLYDSLDLEKLESLRYSNYWTSKYRSSVLKQLEMYIANRILIGYIPLIAIVGVASVVMQFVLDGLTNNIKKGG